MKGGDGVRSVSITSGTIIRALIIVLGFFLVWFLRDIVLVVLTSIVLASFVDSAIPFFERFKIGRVFGSVILYVLGIGSLALLFYLFAPLLITEMYNFAIFASSYAPDIGFLNYFQNMDFSGAKDLVANLSGEEFSISYLTDISKAFIANLSGGFINTLAVAFGGIFNFILIVVISFYLSVQKNGIENFLRIVLPYKYEDYAVDLWTRTKKKIAYWIKGQMLLALLVTILIYLVLSLLGVQYALLLAIIAGVMELVPYGILVALVPAMSFSYISGGVSDMLLVAGAYTIIHQFEVFLLTPLIVSNVVGLSPLVVILAVLVGFEIAGVWGIVLAIPMAVLLMEYMSDTEKKKKEKRAGAQ